MTSAPLPTASLLLRGLDILDYPMPFSRAMGSPVAVMLCPAAPNICKYI